MHPKNLMHPDNFAELPPLLLMDSFFADPAHAAISKTANHPLITDLVLNGSHRSVRGPVHGIRRACRSHPPTAGNDRVHSHLHVGLRGQGLATGFVAQVLYTHKKDKQSVIRLVQQEGGVMQAKRGPCA